MLRYFLKEQYTKKNAGHKDPQRAIKTRSTRGETPIPDLRRREKRARSVEFYEGQQLIFVKRSQPFFRLPNPSRDPSSSLKPGWPFFLRRVASTLLQFHDFSLKFFKSFFSPTAVQKFLFLDPEKSSPFYKPF